MASCIAFHSYKGGTGKTTIAANLAALLAKKGNRVFLLDLDVYAPSLQAYFDAEPKKWINDFLNNTAEIEDIILDVTPTLEKVYHGNSHDSKTSSSSSSPAPSTLQQEKEGGRHQQQQQQLQQQKEKEKISGKLWVAFCSSKKEDIYKLEGGGKQETSKIQLLRRFILLREQLISLHDADYIIIDTSPGIRYWSINALAVADMLFLTLKMGDLDIDGTTKMAEEIYGSFTKFGAKSYLIMNRVAGYCVPNPIARMSVSPIPARGDEPSLSQSSSSSSSSSSSVSPVPSYPPPPAEQYEPDNVTERLREESNIIARSLASEVKMDVIAGIACYCDIQFATKEFLTVLEYPNHPFAKQFEKLVEIIESIQTKNN
jgi:MinD-like ATPase involved in chromosome partitioning or flagellar assembly